MLFLGILIYYVRVNRFSYAILAGVAMAGAVMVSYAKARAESLGPSLDVGFWERPERLVLMIIGGLVGQMGFILWILAIGSNLTVIHRIVHTWMETEGKLRKRLADGPATAPLQLSPKVAPEPPDARPRSVLTRSAGRGN